MHAALPRLTLLLGGARSGKSALAQRLAEGAGPSRLFLATAEAFDPEMEARIARHRADRGAGWDTREAPRDLPAALAAARAEARHDVLLADCLTLWLSNLMLAEPPADLDAAAAALLAALAPPSPGAPQGPPVILVSNEVGQGIVPATPLGRAFRDAQGRLNRAAAEAADDVALVVAGLPLPLKRGGAPCHVLPSGPSGSLG